MLVGDSLANGWQVFLQLTCFQKTHCNIQWNASSLLLIHQSMWNSYSLLFFLLLFLSLLLISTRFWEAGTTQSIDQFSISNFFPLEYSYFPPSSKSQSKHWLCLGLPLVTKSPIAGLRTQCHFWFLFVFHSLLWLHVTYYILYPLVNRTSISTKNRKLFSLSNRLFRSTFHPVVKGNPTIVTGCIVWKQENERCVVVVKVPKKLYVYMYCIQRKLWRYIVHTKKPRSLNLHVKSQIGELLNWPSDENTVGENSFYMYRRIWEIEHVFWISYRQPFHFHPFKMPSTIFTIQSKYYTTESPC